MDILSPIENYERLETQASVLHQATLYHLVWLTEVRAWADRWLEKDANLTDNESALLIEVSTSPQPEALEALSRLASKSCVHVLEPLLGLMAHLHTNQRLPLERVASLLASFSQDFSPPFPDLVQPGWEHELGSSYETEHDLARNTLAARLLTYVETPV